MHVSQGIEKRDMYIQVRRLVRCKLTPLLLHLDGREIGAAKRLGPLRSQPHAAPFEAAWKTVEPDGKPPHGFLDRIQQQCGTKAT